MECAYQVSFTAFDCGRNIPRTKRCIKWRFGFPVEDPEDGFCRGIEHEVMLIWSITSGKRVVKFDGDQIHCSRVKRSEKMNYSWKWNEIDLELTAYAAPPIRARDGFCLNDLKVNGKSFQSLGPICDIPNKGKEKVKNVAMPHSNDIQKDNNDINAEHDDIASNTKDEETFVVGFEDGSISEHLDEHDRKNKRLEEEDDISRISCSSSDNGLLSNEHLCSHDFKTEDINPNEPPSFEDLERENSGAARIDKNSVSYEEVWGRLESDGDDSPSASIPRTGTQQSTRRSPKSVRSFGGNRKVPNRKVKRNLAVRFDKLKLSPPSLVKSPERASRNSSFYKELDV
jgi:hypothetical protein